MITIFLLFVSLSTPAVQHSATQPAAPHKWMHSGCSHWSSPMFPWVCATHYSVSALSIGAVHEHRQRNTSWDRQSHYGWLSVWHWKHPAVTHDRVCAVWLSTSPFRPRNKETPTQKWCLWVCLSVWVMHMWSSPHLRHLSGHNLWKNCRIYGFSDDIFPMPVLTLMFLYWSNSFLISRFI